MTYQEWKKNELAGEGGFTFAEEELTLSAYNAGLEHNEQNVCGECSPDNYGWIFNRVEGKAACACMTEAEPFQILLQALEAIVAKPTMDAAPLRSIAKVALRTVLPLDYAE